jgi:hypothetical protein
MSEHTFTAAELHASAAREVLRLRSIRMSQLS